MAAPTSPRHPLRTLGTAVGALSAVVLLWHLLTAVWGVIPPMRFPMPLDVAGALQQIAIEGYEPR